MTVDISKYSTMQIGGEVDSLFKLKNEKDIESIVLMSAKLHVPIFILGEGSNTIFTDKYHDLIIGKMEVKGIEIKKTNLDNVLIEVGAGENWDNVVKWSVNKNLSGVEALSGIPGTTGAAPVQNIGAYGSEVAQVLRYVMAYDTKVCRFVKISNKKCRFLYRESVFKKNPGRWIIYKIALQLKKQKLSLIPNYKDMIKYFESKRMRSPSIKQIRKAIIEIRAHKLPHPDQIPNCGSFFKNPILDKKEVAKLKMKYREIPIFPNGRNKLKVSAGWLLEKAGFKKYKSSKVGVYKNNALVLINKRDATFKDLDKLRCKIKEKVFKMFGVKLVEEVNIV